MAKPNNTPIFPVPAKDDHTALWRAIRRLERRTGNSHRKLIGFVHRRTSSALKRHAKQQAGVLWRRTDTYKAWARSRAAVLERKAGQRRQIREARRQGRAALIGSPAGRKFRDIRADARTRRERLLLLVPRPVRFAGRRVAHPIRTARTVLLILLILVLFTPLTWSDVWSGAKSGAGALGVPSAFGCATPAGPRPVGGIVGAAGKIGRAVHAVAYTPVSGEQILAAEVGVARMAGEVWQTFLNTAQGIPAPTAPPSVAQEVSAGCCATSPGLPSGTTLSASFTANPSDTPAMTAARALIAAGATGDLLTTLTAIAGPESGYNPTAQNPSGASGLWQIMLPVNAPFLHGGDWRDPQVNARAAVEIWRSQGYGAWTTWTSGAYQTYRPAAQLAVTAVQGGDTGSPAAQPACAQTSAPASFGTGGTVVETAIGFATAQVGKPYLFGAAPMPTPTGPVPAVYDCSSLVDSAYLAAGLDLPGRETTGTLLAQYPAVTHDAMIRGDLVFPSPGHVGIYLGNGQMIDAPHTGAFVRVEPVYAWYAARRVTSTPA